jgi:hypothetical protein
MCSCQSSLSSLRKLSPESDESYYGSFLIPPMIQLIANVRFGLPLQPVDATHALKRSAGVSNFNVSRGRSG